MENEQEWLKEHPAKDYSCNTKYTSIFQMSKNNVRTGREESIRTAGIKRQVQRGQRKIRSWRRDD